MSFRVERCEPCGLVYLLEQYSMIFAEGAPTGIIVCPGCGNKKEGNPEFAYLGHMIPLDDRPQDTVGRP